MIGEYKRTLTALADQLGYFLRAREVRLLELVVPADLRRAALQLVVEHELHPESGHAFVAVEAPCDEKDAGWTARTRELRAHHDHRKAWMEKHAQPLPPLEPILAGGIAGFAQQLVAMRRALGALVDGITVVLAPRRVSDTDQWRRDLEALVTAKDLGEIRWIAASEETRLGPLLDRLGPRAMRVELSVDERRSHEELAAMMDAAAAAPSGAHPFAIVGAAWPRGVIPPRRVRERPVSTDSDELVRSLDDGAHATLVGPGGTTLRNLIFRAALAARRDDGKDEALTTQREACAFCAERGLERELGMLSVALATYHQRFGEEREAIAVLESTAARAMQHGVLDIAATADLTRGSLLRALGAKLDALTAYRRAAVRGTGSPAPLLVVIEARRLSAEMAQELALADVARTELEAAVQAAASGPGAEVAATTAGECARMLAQIYRSAGLPERALALMDLANTFERGETPAAVPFLS